MKGSPGISGYDIIQKINRNFRGLWRGSAGTIYPLLNKLATHEFVNIEETTDTARLKKIYYITEKGITELNHALKNNFRISINSLGDFLQTIIKAIPRFEENVSNAFCCFPFHDFPTDEKIDEEDFSKANIARIKSIVNRLEVSKEKLEKRLERINNTLESYNSLLKKIKAERKMRKQPLEIYDDDDDYVI
ncbi:MAG: PadR family transcriptional regulator [Candidatus Hodarchaeota archaeon]